VVRLLRRLHRCRARAVGGAVICLSAVQGFASVGLGLLRPVRLILLGAYGFVPRLLRWTTRAHLALAGNT
jgi:hypothetical protein